MPSKPREPLTATRLWATWRMGYAKGVIECALAHQSADKVRAVYHRAQYLDERRKLLQGWADMIDGKRAGGGVVPITPGARHASSPGKLWTLMSR